MAREQSKIIIRVADLLATILASRDVVNDLKSTILKTSAYFVILDFKKVEFMSRSAAHELLSLKEDLSRKQNDKRELTFINTNPDITKMLRVVAMNRALPKVDPMPKIERIDLDSLVKQAYI